MNNSFLKKAINLFKGKKILIHGLGLNNGGVGVVKFLSQIPEVQILITDLRNKEQLAPSLEKLKKEIKSRDIKLILGEHREEDFIWADIVIRNPAIPVGNKFIKIAKDHGAKVFMDVSLFMSLVSNPIIGITGTKGKSTTTLLIYEILKEFFKKNDSSRQVHLAGNIGKTPIELLDKISKNDVIVLELSSFQLSVMGENKQSPHIAVVTNVFTDHINWHKTFEHYLWSKVQITAHQSSEDYLVLNKNNKFFNEFINNTHAQKIVVTEKFGDKADLYVNDNIVYFNNTKLIDISKRSKSLQGEHNVQNLLLAVAATHLTDMKVDTETILNVINKFQGAYGRQQFLLSIGNVDFYNDTAATVDVAILAAINRYYNEYNNNVVLIMGGVDKGIDYSYVIKQAQGKLHAIVLLEGTASEKIQKEADKYGIKTYGFYGDFKKAIHKAFEVAKQGANKTNSKWAVSLTPGAASFNMFLNEWDRGHKFDEIVRNLAKKVH